MNRTLSGYLSVLVAAVLAAGLSGCGASAEGEEREERRAAEPNAEPVGELVASWNQREPGEHWIAEIDALPVLLLTPDDLDRWIADAPVPSSEFEALGEVDLDDHALVIGRYARCSEVSAVYVEALEGERPLVRFAVESDRRVECVWAPYVLDAWAVPREQTGGQPPRAVSSAPQEAPGKPAPVGSLVHTRDETHASAEDLSSVVADHGGLLSDAGERDALADALAAVLQSDDATPDAIRAVDMDQNHLVVTSYHKCTEVSEVFADPARDPTLLWIEVTGEPEVVCEWSPFTIDVWQVGHDEVSERAELGQYRPFWAP